MRKSVLVFLVAFLMIATLVSMALVPSTFAQGGPTPTLTPEAWTVEAAIALYSISGTYEFAECEYEGAIEPECWKFTGTIQMTNPHDQWVDGYRRCAGPIRPAYAAMQRADRISIPPNYETTPQCFVEVLVARPLAPKQQTSLELRGENEVQWTLEEAREFYDLQGPDAEIKLHGLQSWEVPEIEGESWLITNVCSNWVDGYRTQPGEVRPDFSEHPEGEYISIPPRSYRVEAMMITLRPCDEVQSFTLRNLGDQPVNLRMEPSENATRVGGLAPGAQATSDGFVVVDDKEWYRVYMADGSTIWVAGWVVNVTPIEATPTLVPAASAPSAPAAPVPAAPVVTDWSESTVRALFGIPAETMLTQCPGENACWQTTGPHSITNSTQCWQGGYTIAEHEMMEGQSDAKTGIPPGWSGIAEVAVLRPC